MAASLAQVHLLGKTPSPRVILVGGSNVAMGLDAELMQRELGIPVINDGLHAGLGIVPLRELEPYIGEGDVIIVSLEYSMFSSNDIMNGDPAFLSDWIEVSPSRLRYLSDPFVAIPSMGAVLLQRKVNRSLEYALNGGSLSESRAMFNSSNFNANGDFVGHLQAPSLARKRIPFDPYPIQPVQDDIFVFLNSYDQAIQARGAQMYFEAPASRQVNCEATGLTNLAAFFETLKDRMSMPILTPIDQVCIPDKYFFDTLYHLNAEGRELRTRRLIANLKQALATGN
jgi:hypothetical protein